MQTEAGTGVMQHSPETWGHQGLEATGRSLLWSFRRELSPAHTLTSEFWLPELRENKFCCFGHQMCGNCFLPPKKPAQP